MIVRTKRMKRKKSTFSWKSRVRLRSGRRSIISLSMESSASLLKRRKTLKRKRRSKISGWLNRIIKSKKCLSRLGKMLRKRYRDCRHLRVRIICLSSSSNRMKMCSKVPLRRCKALVEWLPLISKTKHLQDPEGLESHLLSDLILNKENLRKQAFITTTVLILKKEILQFVISTPSQKT